MSFTKSGAIPFLLALGVLVPPAQGLNEKSFLLRIESRSDLTSECEGVETDTLIFHDGLVIRKSVAEDGEIELLRLMSPPEAIRRLTSALRVNRVGVARGDCAVSFAQPNAFFDSHITWFGKAGRMHSFTVSAPGGNPCPENTNALFKAISDFIGVASLDPAGERVVIHVAPSCE